MERKEYRCPKCNGKQYKIESVWVPGSLGMAIFHFSNREYTSVICTKCNYAELYRIQASRIKDVLV